MRYRQPFLILSQPALLFLQATLPISRTLYLLISETIVKANDKSSEAKSSSSVNLHPAEVGMHIPALGIENVVYGCAKLTVLE